LLQPSNATGTMNSLSNYQNPSDYLLFLAVVIIALAALIEIWQYLSATRRKRAERIRKIDESGIVISPRTASYYKGRRTPFIAKSEVKSLKSLDEENIKKINKKYWSKFKDEGKYRSRLTYLMLMPWRKFYRKEISDTKKTTGFQSRSRDYNKIYSRKKPAGYEPPEKSLDMISAEIIRELQNEEQSVESSTSESLVTHSCPECGLEMAIYSQDTSLLVCSCGNQIMIDKNKKQELRDE